MRIQPGPPGSMSVIFTQKPTALEPVTTGVLGDTFANPTEIASQG